MYFYYAKRLFVIWTCFFTFTALAEKVDTLLAEGDKSIFSENYLMALDQFQKVINLLENENNETSHLAYAYMKMAICYDYFDYFDYSKVYILKALELYNKLKDKHGKAFCFAFLGDMLEDAGNNIEAMKYHKAAYSLFSELHDENGKAFVLDNMASVHENYQKYDSSIVCLEKAYSIYKKLNNLIGISTVLNNYGDIYQKMGNSSKALQYYRKSLMAANQASNKEEVRGNMKDMAKAYASIKKYKEAYDYFERFYEAHRMLKIEKKIEEIARLQVQALKQKKEIEIKALKAEKQIESLRFIITIGCLAFLFLVVLFIYIAFRIQAYKDKQVEILRREKLEIELEMRKKKLVAYTQSLTERGEVIEELRQKIDEALQKDKNKENFKFKAIQQLMQSIILTEDDWQRFKKEFDGVYEGFFLKLSENYPDFSQGDLRLSALLKLKLSMSEIGNMMGISPESVKKAKKRLRKKISTDEDFDLKTWIKEL
jgi:tetratricopeptide (TPR) repeat protein